MSGFIWRLSIALMIPAVVALWGQSKLLAIAIVWPLVANLYVVARNIDLAVEHPARVLVPAISAALGFAELYAESRDGKPFSRAAILGLLLFASGGADIAALPTFAILNEWAVPPIQCVVCLALLFISTWKGRFRWESSLLA